MEIERPQTVGRAPVIIIVAHKLPGKPATVTTLDVSSIEPLQALLGGKGVTFDGFRWTNDVYAYCDDEGLSRNLPLNFMRGDDPIVGPVVFTPINAMGEEIGFGNEAAAVDFCEAFNKAYAP
jgi:hypothetical protein